MPDGDKVKMSLPKHTVELHQSLRDVLAAIDQSAAAVRIRSLPSVARARVRADRFDAWLRDGKQVVDADDAARVGR